MQSGGLWVRRLQCALWRVNIWAWGASCKARVIKVIILFISKSWWAGGTSAQALCWCFLNGSSRWRCEMSVSANKSAAKSGTSPRSGRITRFPIRALCRSSRRITLYLQRAISKTVESKRKTILLDHRGLCSIPVFPLLPS